VPIAVLAGIELAFHFDGRRLVCCGSFIAVFGEGFSVG
jgi:hypothetical protein